MSTYSLYGFINFLDVKSGFVTPVFKHKDAFYSQVEEKNIIKEIIKLPAIYNPSIQEINSPNLFIKVGEVCVYVYYHLKEAHYGIAGNLQHRLKDLIIDKELLASFINSVPERKIKIIKKERVEKIILEPGTKNFILGLLYDIAWELFERRVFYEDLGYENIFKSAEILKFITNKESSSFNAYRQIKSLIYRSLDDKDEPEGRSEFKKSDLFYLMYFGGARRDFVSRWLKYEKQFQQQFTDALSVTSIFPNEIITVLEKQLKTLVDDYETLKVLVLEYEDVEI